MWANEHGFKLVINPLDKDLHTAHTGAHVTPPKRVSSGASVRRPAGSLTLSKLRLARRVCRNSTKLLPR